MDAHIRIVERAAIRDFFALIGEFVAGRRVVPPVPDGYLPDVSAEDPDEDDKSLAGAEVDPLGLFIRYRDAAGNETARRITVKVLNGPPSNLITAYCHERRAMRRFRIDRVIEAVDPRTGEVLDVRGLASHLSDAGAATIAPMARRIVNILVFFGACDHHICEQEWEAIDASIESWCLRYGKGSSECVALQRLARQIAPDSDDLMIGLRSIAAQDDRGPLGRWLNRAVDRIVSADARHSREEFDWLLRTRDLMLLATQER